MDVLGSKFRQGAGARGGRKTDLCKPIFAIFVFIFIIVIVFSYPEKALTVSQSLRGSYQNFEKIFPSRDQNLQPYDLRAGLLPLDQQTTCGNVVKNLDLYNERNWATRIKAMLPCRISPFLLYIIGTFFLQAGLVLRLEWQVNGDAHGLTAWLSFAFAPSLFIRVVIRSQFLQISLPAKMATKHTILGRFLSTGAL